MTSCPSRHGDLRIYEELLLLVLDDQKGTFNWREHVSLAIAAAADIELIRLGRLSVDPIGSPLVRVVDASPTGDALLDLCLATVASGTRAARLTMWIKRQAKDATLRHVAAARLVERGILEIDEQTVLGVINVRRYREVDHVLEAEVIGRIEAAIFAGADDIDIPTRILIALIDPTGTIDRIFGAKRVLANRNRIIELTSESAVGYAIGQAIRDYDVAVGTVGGISST